MITSPILLDSTGQSINKTLQRIADILTPDNAAGIWSIQVDDSIDSSKQITMSGDTASWRRYRAKLGRYLCDHTTMTARKLHRDNSSLLADVNPYEINDQNIFVHFPPLYYKVITEYPLSTIYLSEAPFADSDVMRDDWIGAFIAGESSGKLVSVPNLTPSSSKTINTFWSMAQATSPNYGLMDYHHLQKLIIVYLCEFLDWNSQSCIGNGMTGTGDNWVPVVYNAKTGATLPLGDHSGRINFTEDGQNVGGACHVSLFGVEDLWGWFWQMVQGVFFGSIDNNNPEDPASQQGTEAFIYEGNRMPSSEELKTHPSGLYRTATRITTSGFQHSILFGPYIDVITKRLGGSSNTSICDYTWNNNTGQLLLWGGYARSGSRAGLVYSNSSNAFGTSISYFAARLASYKNFNII